MRRVFTFLILIVLNLSSTMGAGNDNNVEWDGVNHNPSSDVPNTSPVVKYRYFDNANNQTVFYLQVYKGDITSANLVWRNGFGDSDHYVSMSWSHNSADGTTYDYWKCTLPKQNSSSIYYIFQINDGSDTDWAGPGGGGANGVVHENEPTNSSNWWVFDDTPLPVELVSFFANALDSKVELKWQTATEVNNYGFYVERINKNKNSDWQTLGFVKGHGNSNSPRQYTFVDNTANNGNYSYRLKQVDVDGSFEYSPVVEVFVGAPDKFELSQNYPNPFNPATIIKYSIPAVAVGNEIFLPVQLKVYNVLGREIITLVNKEQSPGTYTVTFNAENFPSGLYFYKLTAGSFSQTKKMLLLK